MKTIKRSTRVKIRKDIYKMLKYSKMAEIQNVIQEMLFTFAKNPKYLHLIR